MSGTAGRLAFKLIATLLAIPVGRAVTKGVQKAWLAARPDDPIKDPKNVETRWQDALIWAGLTGIGTAVGSLVATKGADTVWRAITGRPAPHPKTPKAQSIDGESKEPASTIR
jgi:hypothetical protein